MELIADLDFKIPHKNHAENSRESTSKNEYKTMIPAPFTGHIAMTYIHY